MISTITNIITTDQCLWRLFLYHESRFRDMILFRYDITDEPVDLIQIIDAFHNSQILKQYVPTHLDDEQLNIPTNFSFNIPKLQPYQPYQVTPLENSGLFALRSRIHGKPTADFRVYNPLLATLKSESLVLYFVEQHFNYPKLYFKANQFPVRVQIPLSETVRR